MQEQGKRLLLAVALALVVMLVYQWACPGEKPKPPDPIPTTGQMSTSTPVENAKEVRCASEKLETFNFPNFTATFSSCGGSLVGWKLLDPRYKQDPAGAGELIRKGPDRIANDPGSLQVNLRDSAGLPIVPPAQLWVGKKLDDGMEYTLDLDNVHLKKTFRIVPESYMLWMTFSGNGTRKDALTPTVTLYGWQDPKTDSSSNARVAPRVWQSVSYANGDKFQTADLDIGGEKGESRKTIDLRWTGFEHPYLAELFAINDTDVSKHTWADSNGLMRTQIEMRPAAGGTLPERTVVGYLGPKSYSLLENADAVTKFDTSFKDSIDFGHLPGIGIGLGMIGRPLLWMLAKIYNVVGNWGVAIILLTLIVKGVTLYWTTKSMRSMKAMAAVSPQVQELQKKYGDDKQRAQIETMALYKQHGIRPLLGCAPMFLQIPIWSALYIMLSATGELYLQPFIPGWIDDLTATDPYYILPVALFIMMFVQARLTPQNAAQPGAKMMQYGMPIMFGVMSFYFPSGLTLYIFTNTVLSSIHSVYMNKFDKKSLALKAMLEKNKADAEARAKAEEEAKAVAEATGKAGKSGKKKPAPKVVDVEAVEKRDARETSEDDAVDGDGADDDASEASDASTAVEAPSATRPRKRKKRRK